MDGESLALGRHTLRFLETPHVHHWDSMMVVEESTKSLFPSDLFLQPGDQPPVVSENLGQAMCDVYRAVGIFAHERPVRRVVDRLADSRSRLGPRHARRLADARGAAVLHVGAAEKEFAYRGLLLGRKLEEPVTA